MKYYTIKMDDDDSSDGNINTSIKPISKNIANAEIEKGEIVYTPDGKLLRATGKRHSNGGTPVFLEKGSFVFSDFNKLNINPLEKKLFNLKTGKATTPAKTLAKEIDLEHHNKMLTLASSNDKITANTANLMLGNYRDPLGKIAFLQESKKGGEAPDFAQGTAPVYSNELSDDLKEIQQYQTGGLIHYPGDRSNKENRSIYSDNQWNEFAKSIGFTGKTNKEFQQFLWNNPKYSAIVKQLHNEKGMPNGNKYDDGKIGWRWDKIKSEIEKQTNPNVPVMPDTPTLGEAPPAKILDNTPKITGAPTGDSDGSVVSKRIDTPLTAFEKLTIARPFLQAANVKTQLPLRQQQESVIPTVLPRNNQREINQLNNSYYDAKQQLRGVNPGVAPGAIQEMAGKRLDGLNRLRVDDFEVQNQQKQIAAQVYNQDAATNRQLDRTYYDQTQTAQMNADNAREVYTNKGYDILGSTMAKNANFNNAINSQQFVKGKQIGVDKEGKPIYESTLPYLPKAGFFSNTVEFNPEAKYDWQNSQGVQSKSSVMKDILTELRASGVDVNDSKNIPLIKSMVGLYTANSLRSIPFSNGIPGMKQGGKFR